MSGVEKTVDTTAPRLASLRELVPIRLEVGIRYISGTAGEALGRTQAEAVRAAMRALELIDEEDSHGPSV